MRIRPATVADAPAMAVAKCFVLYVDLPRQRQGIGQVLLADASESLASKGFRSLAIGVLTANTPADLSMLA